ncbi:MAG TPA: ABC transporter permease [Thermoanaerobaculia bacterium]|jgi:putative ABC transport system permease protein
MTRHLLKLVWNRKRSNALMIMEICVSFLVVFVVATMGLFLLDNYRIPLGFEWKEVWNVRMGVGRNEANAGDAAAQQATLTRLFQEVRSLEPVEAAAGSFVVPFDQGGWEGSYRVKGRKVDTGVDRATAGFDKVMGLRLVAGRWFEEPDATQSWEPVVIDQDLARAVYGTADPVGKALFDPSPDERPFRVVGVVSDFRKGGELLPNDNFLFRFSSFDHPEGQSFRNLLIRVRPGTPAAFEEALVKRMQQVAPDWSFEVRPLSQVRATAFRFFLTPLIVAGTVAFFLLLMVGLGLIGVLWQNLLQRTREIGLRRAAGASRAAVHRQVLLEQLVLTSLGVLVGTLLVIQVPVLHLIGVLSDKVFTAGLLVAMAAMYLLSVLCALYPSALAARVQPAEALRYE